MTHVEQSRPVDYERARQLIERGMGMANYAAGLLLTAGGLAFAIHWRLRYGGYGSLRAFYLYTAWAFGVMQLLAGMAMLRRWPVRWIMQMLPLIVPIVAYQYFVLHFIFRRF